MLPGRSRPGYDKTMPVSTVQSVDDYLASSYQPDREYIEGMIANGHTMLDGGRDTVPELDLESIHNRDREGGALEHYGFGNFGNDLFAFDRADSQLGTRFYTKTARP